MSASPTWLDDVENDVDDVEYDRLMAERELRSAIKDVKAQSYLTAMDDGKVETVQDGFNEGFVQGAIDAYRGSYFRGILEAIEAFYARLEVEFEGRADVLARCHQAQALAGEQRIAAVQALLDHLRMNGLSTPVLPGTTEIAK